MVVIDGMARSGKSLIATAVSNVEKMEPWQLPPYVDHVVKYLEMGEFTLGGAQAALRIALNSHAFDYAVGRGINRRLSDQSNVDRCEKQHDLAARERIPSYEVLLEEFRDSSRIPVFVTHEQITHAAFWMETIPHLNYIEVCRHPATLMASWSRRGLTQRWGDDPLLFVPCPTLKGRPYPLFAQQVREQWVSAPDDERLLLSMELQFQQLWRAIEALSSDQRQFFRILRIESFKEEPSRTLSSLLSWLGAGSFGPRFDNFLEFEELPRGEQSSRVLSATSELLEIYPRHLHGRLHLLIEEYEDQLGSLRQFSL